MLPPFAQTLCAGLGEFQAYERYGSLKALLRTADEDML